MNTNQTGIRNKEKKDLSKTPAARIAALIIIVLLFAGAVWVISETYSNMHFTKAIWNSHRENARYYIYEDFLHDYALIGIDYDYLPYYLDAEADLRYTYKDEKGASCMDYVYKLGHGFRQKDTLYLVFKVKNKKIESYEITALYNENWAPLT